MTESPPPPTSGLTPYLTIANDKGAEAVRFYVEAFGAEERYRNTGESGRIMHSHLLVNGASLMLSDDFPEMRGGAPAPAPAGHTLHLEVDDADRWWERAVRAGATIKMPIQDAFWGDRYGQLADPFGHCWSISSPLKEQDNG